MKSDDVQNPQEENFQKPIYEKSLHPYDKTKKHWRKHRTEPYKCGDRLGFKLFYDDIHFFEDVKKQRQLTLKKFITELISLTTHWTKEQIALGNKPFSPTDNIKYFGFKLNDDDYELADNINWLYEYMNSVRLKKKSYEHCMVDAAKHGIRLLWEYNVAKKNMRMIGGYDKTETKNDEEEGRNNH
jgi:hypothetical protein